jgi:hypothetical protein
MTDVFILFPTLWMRDGMAESWLMISLQKPNSSLIQRFNVESFGCDIPRRQSRPPESPPSAGAAND